MTKEEQDKIVGQMVRERKEYKERQICADKKVNDIKQRLHSIVSAIETNFDYSMNADGELMFAVKGSSTSTSYPSKEEIKAALEDKRDIDEKLQQLNKDLEKYGV